uniref:pyridoxal kinase n=1 Tax=Percolomonas cosmopolitus TaxID=63605 RepID=A0A7S1KW29_9EUKA|mmetsp:Transcript_9353/g.34651  ORF Transcript_9353/g.34651 Transcript_9353/m.34651 type:complete len:314 (+) Transcript_9353:260-1201(+)
MSYQESKGHVLQIQSQVVHGYVGNSASTLPFNLLGFQTSSLNICQYSNHVGYKQWTGVNLKPTDMNLILDGLKLNNFQSNWTHILSGYMSTKELLLELVKFIEDVRNNSKRSMNSSNEIVIKNPSIQYVCDPVLGDNGHLYVPEELVEIYRDKLIPLADLVTPNAFEAEQLTGREIRTEDDALRAVDWFHSKGVGTVVLTSAQCDPGDESKLTMIASRRSSDKDDAQRYKIEFAKKEGRYTGTGDVTAALITSWLTLTNGDLQKSAEMALGGIQSVLDYTKPGHDLNLIPCREFILKPKHIFQAVKIEKEDCK